MPRPRRAAAVAALCAGAVAAGAIGAAAGTAAPAPASRTVTATGSLLAFDARALRAPAGRVRLVLRNRSELVHDIAVKGRNLPRARRGARVSGGGASRVTATLPPGRYTYFCTVFGHEAAGMAGTLTVTRRR